jgi:hypothetical protein
LNETDCAEVAVKVLIGIETRPKEMLPEPVDRAAMEQL